MAQTIYHPGLGQTVNFSVQTVPAGGDAQTEAVIDIMRRYAEEDASSVEIRSEAQKAVTNTPGLDPVEAVYWHVKRQLRFVRDEETAQPFQAHTSSPVVETFIRPRDMVTLCATQGGSCQRLGDCDDYSMYTASLLLALGIPIAFVTVAAQKGSSDFSHVYVAAYPGGKRVPLDVSHGDRPGWETPNYTRRQEWSVGGSASALLPLALIAGVAMLWR